jgi:hypothetical protein
MLSTTCGRAGWVALPKALPCSEVVGSNLANNITFKPISRRHVVAIDWATCRHPIRCKQATSYANCPHDCLPRVIWPCHVLYGLPRQHPYELYGLYSQHNFFLFICHFEQNAISLSSDVCLNPNELCWVHDNEAYAPV